MSFNFGNVAAILIGLLLIAIGAVLIRAAILPTSFRISRSIQIDASPDKVLPMIINFHHFNEWNPFLKADPEAKVVYSGAEQGAGAHFNWSSPGKSGVGNMTITDVTPQAVAIDLNFDKPFSAQNNVVFGLAPKQGGTQLSWTMTGAMPFLHRVLSVFMSFDTMVGREFEKGLHDLNSKMN